MLLPFWTSVLAGAPITLVAWFLVVHVGLNLDYAGFFVNLQKSLWEPSQVGTWLGFHLDFSFNFITVPPSKISKLQGSISRILALVNIVFVYRNVQFSNASFAFC